MTPCLLPVTNYVKINAPRLIISGDKNDFFSAEVAQPLFYTPLLSAGLPFSAILNTPLTKV